MKYSYKKKKFNFWLMGAFVLLVVIFLTLKLLGGELTTNAVAKTISSQKSIYPIKSLTKDEKPYQTTGAPSPFPPPRIDTGGNEKKIPSVKIPTNNFPQQCINCQRFEYKTGEGECALSGNTIGDLSSSISRRDWGIEIDCDSFQQMRAHCTQGRIINYGGSCFGGSEGSSEIVKLTATDFNRDPASWYEFSPINEVSLECSVFPTRMSISLTCMREKTD